MAGNLDYLIDVNVAGSAPTVGAQAFDRIAILAEDAVFAVGTYKVYGSPAEVAADAELTTPALKAFVTSFFSQSRHPGQVIVVECTGTGAYDTSLDAFVAEYGADTWYGLVSDVRVIADMLDMAAWCESRRKVCFVQSDDSTLVELGQLTTLARARTLCAVHDTDTEPVDLGGITHMLATNPDEGVPSYPFHTLADCSAADYTQTIITNILAGDGCLYSTLKGVGATFGGKACNGAFLDGVISGDWLASRIEEGIAQLQLDVAARGGRIPYTDAGIAQIASVVRAWMARAVAVGHILPGFVVSVPALADIPGATIAARTLTITASAVLTQDVSQGVTINIGVSNTP